MNSTGTLTTVYLKILIVSIGNTTFAGAGTTDTGHVALTPLFVVAVMVAVPFWTAVILPSGVIFATLGSLEV